MGGKRRSGGCGVGMVEWWCYRRVMLMVVAVVIMGHGSIVRGSRVGSVLVVWTPRNRRIASAG